MDLHEMLDLAYLTVAFIVVTIVAIKGLTIFLFYVKIKDWFFKLFKRG